MQDYPIVINLAIQFSTCLQAIEQSQGAYLTLEFVRDICEDTYNFYPLLDVYFRMGIILKKMGEYDKALTATKKLLQMSWTLKNELYELKAYENLAFLNFYKQDVNKA